MANIWSNKILLIFNLLIFGLSAIIDLKACPFNKVTPTLGNDGIARVERAEKVVGVTWNDLRYSRRSDG